MSFLINPFAFAVAGGDFESIATVTVGSGGASVIDFTSIPATFQHLQVRGVFRSDAARADTSVTIRLNAVSSTYSRHELYGDGSSALAEGYATASAIITDITAATSTSNVFGAGLADILDYADTSKNATIRSSGGWDANGSGRAHLTSAAWYTTDAVTSVRLLLSHGNFVQHSTAALYGIKA